MGKRKCIVIAIIIVSFVSLTFYTLMIRKELKDYQTGFYLKGTYQTIGGIPGDAEYLAFDQEEEAKKNIFYHFKQFGFKDEGNYINTNNANLYRLSIDNTNIDGSYILADKDKLYIFTDKKISEYEKISDNVVFINLINRETGVPF